MFDEVSATMKPRVEETLASWIARYFVFAIPIVSLFVRSLTALLSQDLKGVFRRVLSLPEDFLFIAFTFVLSGVAGMVPAFTNFYLQRGSNPTTSGLALLLFIVLAAVIVHILDSYLVQPELENFWICNQELKSRAERIASGELTETPAGSYEWEMSHWKSLIMGSFWWSVSLASSGYLFYYVTEIVTGGRK